jgi:hypothetical protein
LTASLFILASTLTCRELAEKSKSSDKTEAYGASVILYWMEGYQATAEQGTVARTPASAS